jgi:hypothetical protein
MTVSRLKVFALFTFLTGGLTACNGVDHGSSSGGVAGGGYGGHIGGGESGGAGGFGPETGGTPSTGGATGGGSRCEGPARPPQAYQCAGQVTEREMLGFNFAYLSPTPYYYACGYDYGTGGYVGVGGTTSTGGAWAGGASAGGSAGAYEEEYPDEYYPNPGPGPGEPDYIGEGGAGPIDGTGGYAMGGEPATGGAFPGTGGTMPEPPNPQSGWCEGLTSGSIVGVSYAVGPCTQSQLRLPLRFQEPDGWYELRVYAGLEACERGTLIYETAGYGVNGAEVEVPVTVSEDQFVSIELQTPDEYWYSGEPAIELLPLPGGE